MTVAYDEDFAAHVREWRSELRAVGECRVFDGRDSEASESVPDDLEFRRLPDCGLVHP
jgi:hypothetical protein